MSGKPADAETIDALLPQTQCGECGYRGCRPYADAVASDAAAINLCSPGGGELVAELAALLGREAIAPHTGVQFPPPAVAVIDESACIGCTLCLAACPVDAIIGARRRMHTVIAAECTGCALCLPPCPVDCISLRDSGLPYSRDRQKAVAPRLRERYRLHLERLDRQQRQTGTKPKGSKPRDPAGERKQDAVARAMARAQARLATRKNESGG